MGKSLASSAKGVPYYYDDTLSPQIGTSLWEDCPIPSILSNPTIGVNLNAQFQDVTATTNAIAGWTTTTATSGAVTIDANLGLKIDSGAVTANQGVNICAIGARYKVQANKPVWMESRVKFTGIAGLKIQFAFGLAAAGTTALIASGALGTADFIGFEGVTTAGTILSACTASSTTGTGAGLTLVNNGVYKLGFKATTTGVSFYVNDGLVSSLAANIPTGFLAPIVVCQANATTQPIIFVDRVVAVGLA